MPLDDTSTALPPDSQEAFYERYVENCRRLGIKPVSAERAAELVATWDAAFEAAITQVTLQ